MLYLGGYGLSCGYSVGCGAGYFWSALRWLLWLICCAVAYLSGFVVAFCLAWVSQFVLWVLMAFVVVWLYILNAARIANASVNLFGTVDEDCSKFIFSDFFSLRKPS
jgi:hypothetical protein